LGPTCQAHPLLYHSHLPPPSHLAPFACLSLAPSCPAGTSSLRSPVSGASPCRCLTTSFFQKKGFKKKYVKSFLKNFQENFSKTNVKKYFKHFFRKNLFHKVFEKIK
jgi:hypothetical protein